jgi:uncharacterized membrane protein
VKQINEPMLQWGKWLGGAAAGAALMYMLDPERGSARRARSGETLRGLTRRSGSALGDAVHSLGSKVGSGIGRAGSSLGDRADSATDKAAGLADQAGSVVQNATQAASHMAQDVSQGAGQLVHGAQQMMQSTAERMRGDWAPGARGMAVLAGSVLGLYGLLRRTPVGMTLGMAGLALLTRGATNVPLKNIVTGKALGQAIDLEKTIQIDASPEQVYDLWTSFENFPQFMPHVVEVRDLGARRSHWVVRGPAGTQFEWDAVTTEQSRPYRLAWRSEPGAEIAQSGSIQFEPDRGGTRVTVRMSYSPPAGVVGHGIAVLLGADPKRQMDDDLERMKAFIERGGIPLDAARGAARPSRSLH